MPLARKLPCDSKHACTTHSKDRISGVRGGALVNEERNNLSTSHCTSRGRPEYAGHCAERRRSESPTESQCVRSCKLPCASLPDDTARSTEQSDRFRSRPHHHTFTNNHARTDRTSSSPLPANHSCEEVLRFPTLGHTEDGPHCVLPIQLFFVRFTRTG